MPPGSPSLGDFAGEPRLVVEIRFEGVLDDRGEIAVLFHGSQPQSLAEVGP